MGEWLFRRLSSVIPNCKLGFSPSIFHFYFQWGPDIRRLTRDQARSRFLSWCFLTLMLSCADENVPYKSDLNMQNPEVVN